MWEKLIKCASALGGGLAGLMGGADFLMGLLAAAMALDYLSGCIVAWRGRSPKSEHGGVSSKVGFDGLARKAFVLLIVLLATLLDTALDTGTRVFQTAVACYYIANEGISLLENAALMGVPFPKQVLSALEALKSSAEKEDN